MVHPLIESFAGKLIVSAQAYPGEAMRDPRTMSQVAQAAVVGGAAAIRVQGIEDIKATVPVVDVPVIGLWKDGKDGVFITPTLEHARAVAEAGAQIVAIDGTVRPRPDGLTLAETFAGLRESHPEALIMADCGSVEDALASEAAGADIIGTTLGGYTGAREKTPGPDTDFVREVAAVCSAPIVAEGRVYSPADAAAMIAAGAYSVCVGTAITHPSTITGWFVAALDSQD